MGTKLYVGNLSYGTTEDSLRSHFEQCGTVSDVIIITDRDTGRSKGFGFVTMDSDEGAQSAIDQLNGQDLDGRPLRIDEAREKTRR